MSTEVWFRNPAAYIKELVECEQFHIAWDRGFLIKKAIDPIKHASLYYGESYPWRILTVGQQGTAEYRNGDTLDKPTAVYPTWAYGEDASILEDMIENPAGADRAACSDPKCSGDERPVWGQEHRVVITELPNSSSGPGRKFLRYLKELQEDHPECIIHVHGLYGWRVAFGLGWGAADVEPRTAAQKGKVHLPSGGEQLYERVQAHPTWVTVLGFRPVDLAVPRNRCMYNIKSAVWAAENYIKLYKFKTSGMHTVDHTSSDDDHEPATALTVFTKRVKPAAGDKLACDTCSLQLECKYYRKGAVCSVPGAEPAELARFFKTRDSDMIIDGLGTLLAANTRRLQSGMQAEEFDGDLNPEVTKMMNQIFSQGVQLAKLVNPDLRGGTKVNVNVGNGGAAAVSVSNPNVLMGAMIRELEARGVSRDKITTEMIEGMLSGMADPEKSRQAIEGQVVESRIET